MLAPLVVLVVIAFAAYRLAAVLAGVDSLLEEWSRWLQGRAYHLDDCGELVHDVCGDPVPRPGAGLLRRKLVDLLTCPFCLGYWISLVMLCCWTALWPWELGWRGWITSLGIAGAQSMLTVYDKR